MTKGVRFHLLLGMVVIGSLAHGAEVQADIVIDLRDCRAVTDSLQRLVCYDQIDLQIEDDANIAIEPLATTPEMPETKPMASSDRTPQRLPSQREHPVAPSNKLPEPKPVARSQQASPFAVAASPKLIESAVSMIRERPRGELIISLENGQVWVQQSNRKVRLQVGDAVTVKRGPIGGYRLNPPTGKSIRVQMKK